MNTREISAECSGDLAHGSRGIANSTEMSLVLSHLLKQFMGPLQKAGALYIAVPSDITQVEKRAFFHVLSGKISAGRSG